MIAFNTVLAAVDMGESGMRNRTVFLEETIGIWFCHPAG